MYTDISLLKALCHSRTHRVSQFLAFGQLIYQKRYHRIGQPESQSVSSGIRSLRDAYAEAETSSCR